MSLPLEEEEQPESNPCRPGDLKCSCRRGVSWDYLVRLVDRLAALEETNADSCKISILSLHMRSRASGMRSILRIFRAAAREAARQSAEQ